MKDKINNETPLLDLVRRLYPICRSITGEGVRESLRILEDWVPLDIVEVSSGTKVFDWVVPDEWSIRSAYIEAMNGDRIVDFSNHNLHVLNFSEPIDSMVGRTELENHLHSIKEHPDWIPYRTSYYSRQWGFCLSDNQRRSLKGDKFHVFVDADRRPGSLTYGELRVPGRTDREVILYTHICHPSLCNDNLSGMAVLASFGKALIEGNRRDYTYRLIFAPGTIGSITWLARNEQRLGRIRHGLVVGLLGDDAPFTYKQTRYGNAEIDEIVEYVLSKNNSQNRVIEFSPYGYDERQFGSPGINLPVGRLTRSVNGAYPQYHTSADDLSILSEQRLMESQRILHEVVETLENNKRYVNLQPYCEPQLGKRGLYRETGGGHIEDRESAMLWLLNQGDGRTPLLDIAKKANIDFRSLVSVAEELESYKLLCRSKKNRERNRE